MRMLKKICVIEKCVLNFVIIFINKTNLKNKFNTIVTKKKQFFTN